MDEAGKRRQTGRLFGVPRMRSSMEMERYLPDDGRLECEECDHTQFRDRSIEAGLAWCLDCGGPLEISTWSILNEPLLSDEELADIREEFNEIWFGNSMMGE